MNPLFFTRGRGMGHAIPDMAIADELPACDWKFVSYGKGYETLRKAARDVIDIGPVEEVGRGAVVASKAFRVMQDAAPDIVIAHEEPSAIVMARALDIPSVYLAGWLYGPQYREAQEIALADRAIIWCEPGLFPAPANMEFVGPFVRKMERWGQINARDALQVPMVGTVIAVIIGAHATDNRTPVMDIVLNATRELPVTVLWVGASNESAKIYPQYPHVTFLPFQDDIARVICASDLVITVGNKVTVQECAALGVPTISLSPQTNPMDDMMCLRMPSNVHLNLKAVTAPVLAEWIRRVLLNPPPTKRMEATVGAIAQKIAHAMCQLTGGCKMEVVSRSESGPGGPSVQLKCPLRSKEISGSGVVPSV